MADEISTLADLENKGEITDAGFEQLKAHVIARTQLEHSSSRGQSEGWKLGEIRFFSRRWNAVAKFAVQLI
jgi:hypothetical protein